MVYITCFVVVAIISLRDADLLAADVGIIITNAVAQDAAVAVRGIKAAAVAQDAEAETGDAAPIGTKMVMMHNNG